MTTPDLVALPGSVHPPLPSAKVTGPVDYTEWVELTIVTRRMAELPRTRAGAPARVSRTELQQQYGSDPADQALVGDVLAGLGTGIEVIALDPGGRRMKVGGTTQALSSAFGAQISQVSSVGQDGAARSHRQVRGGLSVPSELDGTIVAVLGLDTRPAARYQYRIGSGTAVSYTAPQVGAAYEFPAGTNGTGQLAAIIELGGGFGASDLSTYFSTLGITEPSVTAVGVDGATNVPDQDPSGADGEVLLDIEMVGALAPGARQLVYFAPNTDQGFIDAVTTAGHASPAPATISISWGQSEDAWTAQSRTALDQAIADAAALGVTVCVAAGDNGSSDGAGSGPHVDFPASSPHALGCGGTTLQIDTTTGAVQSETVWNDGTSGGATGGGVSDVFALPTWQATAGVPALSGGQTGRGVPDVAGNADPETGYQVYIDGNWTVIGGTSAVAPLWAALVCRMAQATGKPFGLIQEAIYAGVTPGQPVVGLRDITTGNNGAYQAGPGWDACTGLGVPVGGTLLSRLESTTVAAQPEGLPTFPA
jgi:kumamolisin